MCKEIAINRRKPRPRASKQSLNVKLRTIRQIPSRRRYFPFLALKSLGLGICADEYNSKYRFKTPFRYLKQGVRKLSDFQNRIGVVNAVAFRHRHSWCRNNVGWMPGKRHERYYCYFWYQNVMFPTLVCLLGMLPWGNGCQTVLKNCTAQLLFIHSIIIITL